MYENSATYTWWEIEDGVGLLATQAVNRWEALGLPKDAVEVPAVLQVWETSEEEIAYTIALFYGGMEVYAADGCIKISGVPPRAVAVAAESAICDSASDLVGDDIAEQLTKGLLEWLHQR